MSSSVEESVESLVLQKAEDLKFAVSALTNYHLSALTLQLELVRENFTNYQEEAFDLIDSQIENILENIEQVSDQAEHNVDECETHVTENLLQRKKHNKELVIDVLLEGTKKSLNIIWEAKAVFSQADNRTLEIKREIENCLTLLDVESCLVTAFNKIIFLENTLSAIVTIAGKTHQDQMTATESYAVIELEKIFYKTVDATIDILDDFLICVLQEFKNL